MSRLEAIGTVTADDKAALAALPAKMQTLPKGAQIVEDGDVSVSCCLVVEGYLFRSKVLPNGNRQIFSLHTAGDIPDLHSLYLNKMDHTLAAMSDCVIARIPHEAVDAALERSPSLVGLL